MIIKIASFFTSLFFLAVLIDIRIFANNEYSKEDVKESCQDDMKNSIEKVENNLIKQDLEKKSNEPELQVVQAKSTDLEISNNNSSNVKNGTVHVACILNKTYSGLPVEIVNATKLIMLLHTEPTVTNRQVPGHCIIVLFYSPSCPFSCMAAPHFNALPRFFPHIKMVAVDAMKYHSFNAQFGIVGTPTLMLFHSGRPAAKLNDTSGYGLEFFANFITKHTGIKPEGKLVVTSADFSGPVSSVPIKETDYYLLLSWLVILLQILYSFYHSTWGRSLMDATLNAWREAEAQHHHAE